MTNHIERLPTFTTDLDKYFGMLEEYIEAYKAEVTRIVSLNEPPEAETFDQLDVLDNEHGIAFGALGHLHSVMNTDEIRTVVESMVPLNAPF